MTGTHQAGLEELSEDRCWSLLGQKELGRLAVSIRNQPDIFPVNYRLDGETIVVRTSASLKLAAAVLGEGVAFEVDAIDELHHSGWSIVVRGIGREIDDLEEVLDADRLLLEPWADGPKNRYLRIVPTAVTGRRLPTVDSD